MESDPVKVIVPLTPGDVMLALEGEASRRVLAACVARAQSAHDVSTTTRIPLTTVYRLIHRLERLHVLVVERSAMTVEGRKYDLFRSRVRAVHLDVTEGGDHVSWEPNPTIETRGSPPNALFTVDGAAG